MPPDRHLLRRMLIRPAGNYSLDRRPADSVLFGKGSLCCPRPELRPDLLRFFPGEFPGRVLRVGNQAQIAYAVVVLVPVDVVHLGKKRERHSVAEHPECSVQRDSGAHILPGVGEPKRDAVVSGNLLGSDELSRVFREDFAGVGVGNPLAPASFHEDGKVC